VEEEGGGVWQPALAQNRQRWVAWQEMEVDRGRD
jgi:hypothetical protein